MDGYNYFVNHLSRFLGETVTIFTTSGGDSGDGFTGVLLSVNYNYVRLLTRIGPPPACALGNCCSGFAPGSVGAASGNVYEDGTTTGGPGTYDRNCGVYSVGSVTDIPVSRIASFVHNAV